MTQTYAEALQAVRERDARIAELTAALWGMIFVAAEHEADAARADEWSGGVGRCRHLYPGGLRCSHLATHAVCWSDRRRDCCDEHLVDALRGARMDGSDATDHPIVDGNLWQNHPQFAELEPKVQEAVRAHEQR